jgi:hypothetical protein
MDINRLSPRNSTAVRPRRRVLPSIMKDISWATRYESSFHMVVAGLQSTAMIQALASNAVKLVTGLGKHVLRERLSCG